MNWPLEFLLAITAYIGAIWMMFIFGAKETAYWMSFAIAPAMAFFVIWMLLRTVYHRIIRYSG